MGQLTKELESYLSEVTGLETTVKPLVSGDLPYFFSRQYILYHLQIGSVKFTAVFLRHSDEFKPAQFLKHLRQAPFIEPDEVCVVAPTLPTYVRKRLIEKRIAFVIPKVQMYLPALGMELRPRSGQKQPISVVRYSPATQVVLIHWLLGRIHGRVTPLELSKQLCYSAMSMTRSLDELETTRIAQVERVGRERLITFPEDRKAAWNKMLPSLRNPVSKRVRILERGLNQWDLLPAGLTVLSASSMISEPVYPEFAASRDAWKAMVKAGVEEIPVEEPGACLLQVWYYDPKVLQVNGVVDPYSLYLSLQDEADEHIELALEKMMERYI